MAEPTPIGERGRREVDALTLDDGWIACSACNQRIAFGIKATTQDARVKCANQRCRAWVRLAPQLRDRVSRVLTN